MDGGKDGKRNRGRSRSEVGKWRMRLDVGGLVGGGGLKGRAEGRTVGGGWGGNGVSWEMDGHSGGIGGKR